MDGNLCCVAGLIVDVTRDCKDDHVIVVGTVKRPQVDPSLFRLGSCFPDRVTQRDAVFNVRYGDCGFTRLVSNSFTRTLWCSSVVWCQSDASCRSLGIGCCTAAVWLWIPLLKLKLQLSLVNQLTVNLRGWYNNKWLYNCWQYFIALCVFSV